MTKAITTIDIGGLQVPASVAALYRETAGVGMENIQDGSLPQLKPIEEKSKALLFDGSKPKLGSLFYSPTKEEFAKARVSLVTVSKGYWTPKVDHKGDVKRTPDGAIETKFNQLVGGILLESMQPFVMFASGVRWKRMNDFVKSIRPLTKNKLAPVPMYALQVDLSTVKTETDNYAVEYTLVQSEDGIIQLTMDEEAIKFLLAAEENLSSMIESFINANEVDRYTGVKLSEQEQPVNVHLSEVTTQEAEEALTEPPEDFVSSDEDVSDDVPF